MGKIALAVFASAVVCAAAYVYPRHMAIVINQGQMRKLEEAMLDVDASELSVTENSADGLFGQYV